MNCTRQMLQVTRYSGDPSSASSLLSGAEFWGINSSPGYMFSNNCTKTNQIEVFLFFDLDQIEVLNYATSLTLFIYSFFCLEQGGGES